jgi:hypothetical protein
MSKTKKKKPEAEPVVVEAVVEAVVEPVVAPAETKSIAWPVEAERELLSSGGYISGGRFYLPMNRAAGTCEYTSKAGRTATYCIFRADTNGYNLLPISKSGKVAHSDIKQNGKYLNVGFRVSHDRVNKVVMR